MDHPLVVGVLHRLGQLLHHPRRLLHRQQVPPADAVGQDLNIIIPESFQERHWTGYDRALAAGETKYRGQSLPTKARKADGTEFYVELSFEIVKDASEISSRVPRRRETEEKVSIETVAG